MRPIERRKWIVEWMLDTERCPYQSVTMLDTEFVDSYIEHTKSKCGIQFVGAPKCPTLSRDLTHLYGEYVLDRVTTGLPEGDASMGFPKWVYTYTIRDASAYVE